MTHATYEDAIEEVQTRAGVSALDAARVVRGTVETLSRALPLRAHQAVSAELPEEFATILRPSESPTTFALDPFLRACAEHSGLDPRFAREQIPVACQVLAEILGPEARAVLRDVLMPDVASLFTPRWEDISPTEDLSEEARTLGRGRPGSRHPIAESAPDRRQANSVAEENPHGDRKLSGARPGSLHPLSGLERGRR